MHSQKCFSLYGVQLFVMGKRNMGLYSKYKNERTFKTMD